MPVRILRSERAADVTERRNSEARPESTAGLSPRAIGISTLADSGAVSTSSRAPSLTWLIGSSPSPGSNPVKLQSSHPPPGPPPHDRHFFGRPFPFRNPARLNRSEIFRRIFSPSPTLPAVGFVAVGSWGALVDGCGSEAGTLAVCGWFSAADDATARAFSEVWSAIFSANRKGEIASRFFLSKIPLPVHHFSTFRRTGRYAPVGLVLN